MDRGSGGLCREEIAFNIHERQTQGGTSVEQRRYEYDGMIHEVPDNGGAYVIFPWNIWVVPGNRESRVMSEVESYAKTKHI